MRATILKPRLGLLMVALLLLPLLLLPVPAGAEQTATPAQVIETKTAAEECRDRCNRDYEMCADEGQASDRSLNGRPSAGFSKNYCTGTLNSCLERCRTL